MDNSTNNLTNNINEHGEKDLSFLSATLSKNEDNEQPNDINNLFIKESDESDNENETNNIKFTSSESQDRLQIIEKYNNNIKIQTTSGTRIINKPTNTLNATSGVNANDEIDTEIELINQEQNNPKPLRRENSINNNGWDDDANKTINNWYQLFKQQSFIYQWILDRNKKMSDHLNAISVVSSSLLGIFSAFKLWIDNDQLFQTISDVILMLLNFSVAFITSVSKRYVDDVRNESFRVYVEKVDKFLGLLSAQVLKSYNYRMNADLFFERYNETYTKIIITAPNLSIYELEIGKKEYTKYSENNIINSIV
jgi:hypothetical protein